MTAQPRYADRDDSPTDDHIIQLHGVTWADYERLLAIRGDHSAPRIAYLHGTVEIMSPLLAAAKNRVKMADSQVLGSVDRGAR